MMDMDEILLYVAKGILFTAFDEVWTSGPNLPGAYKSGRRDNLTLHMSACF